MAEQLLKSPAPRVLGATGQTLQRLRGLIIGGELNPGEQIRQQEMAEQFGVSRMPLREALNALVEQGLLVHRANQGYFVAKRAPAELAQIIRMLQLLEAELMLTLQWPSKEMIKALSGMNREMRAYVDTDDWSPLIAVNRDFHFRIFDLSPHKLILDQVARLWALADSHIATKFVRPELRAQTVAEHDEIIAALASRDRRGSLAALDRHRHSGSVGLATTPLRTSTE